MLACLGEPELYRVVPFLEEDGYYTHLSLWYLQKGLGIETTNPREKDEVPIFDYEIVMEQMYITAPGTVEEVIKSVIYQGVGLDNFSDELLLSLKPWSRAWEEIVVEEW